MSNIDFEHLLNVEEEKEKNSIQAEAGMSYSQPERPMSLGHTLSDYPRRSYAFGTSNSEAQHYRRVAELKQKEIERLENQVRTLSSKLKGLQLNYGKLRARLDKKLSYKKKIKEKKEGLFAMIMRILG